MWRTLMMMSRSQPLFDWKNAFKQVNFDLFKYRFLDPREGEANRVICPNSRTCKALECKCREVREIHGKLVAYCRENPHEQRIPLTEEDIMCFGLNFARFHAEICKAFHLEFTSHDLDSQLFWELGLFKNGTGKRMPVYISYYNNRMALRNRLALLLEKNQPFAVVIPDRMIFPRDMESVLDSKRCMVISLVDMLTLCKDTGFAATSAWQEMLKRRSGSIPDNGVCTYQTPPGISWCSIHVKHINDEYIAVWVDGDAPKNYRFSQLGMVNSVKGVPSLAFEKLLDFLDAPNSRLLLPEKQTKANTDLRNRVRDINLALKRFFPAMTSPAIVLLKQSGDYCTAFTAHPISE